VDEWVATRIVWEAAAIAVVDAAEGTVLAETDAAGVAHDVAVTATVSIVVVCQGVFNTAIEVFSSGVVHKPVVADAADAGVEPCGIACVAADVDAVGVIGVVIVVEREWWVC